MIFFIGVMCGGSLGFILNAIWWRAERDAAFKAGRQAAERMTAASHNNAYKAGYAEGVRSGSRIGGAK